MNEHSTLQEADESVNPLLNPEPEAQAVVNVKTVMDTYSYVREPVIVGRVSTEENSPLLRAKTIANEGRHEGGKTAKPRRFDRLMNIMAFLSLTAMMACAWFSMLWTTPTPRIWIALHAPLTSLALLFFGCGILTLQPTSFDDPDEKKRGLVRHQLFMLVPGISSLVLGFATIWFHKASGSGKHWTTWHAIFGIVTLSCLSLHLVIGASSVWFKGRAFGSEDKAKSIWKYHRFAGYLLFGAFLVTAHLGGMYSNFYAKRTHLLVRFTGFTLAPLIAATAVSARVRLGKMKNLI